MTLPVQLEPTIDPELMVNTDFTQAPECLLGHVLFDIFSRIMFLRQLHGEVLDILLCRVDVKEAFRQIPVDPAGAPAFGYKMDDQVVVDLRCQFGWRSSPGFGSLRSSALEHSHNHTTFNSAVISPEGASAVQHVRVVPPSAGSRVVPARSDCHTISSTGGFAGSPFFVRYYVDDGILTEGRFFSDGRRCLRAVRSLASGHFRLLGSRGPDHPPLLSSSKITNFKTCLEVLVWVLDTQRLTISMTPRKQQKLRLLLDQWPPSRVLTTCRQVAELRVSSCMCRSRYARESSPSVDCWLL